MPIADADMEDKNESASPREQNQLGSTAHDLCGLSLLSVTFQMRVVLITVVLFSTHLSPSFVCWVCWRWLNLPIDFQSTALDLFGRYHSEILSIITWWDLALGHILLEAGECNLVVHRIIAYCWEKTFLKRYVWKERCIDVNKSRCSTWFCSVDRA